MFVADRLPLLSAIAAVLPFASRGAAGALDADEDGRLLVTVGDPDGGARATALGRVVLPGRVALPLEALSRALKCSQGTRVEVAGNAATVAVLIDGESPTPRRYTFSAGEPDDEPEWPTAAANCPTVTLPAESFVRLVERTVFAVERRGPASGGWATAGVEMSLTADRLTLASTDTYRLAVASTAVEGQRTKCPPLLAPEAVLRAWSAVAKKAESVRLTFADSVMLFECGALTAWARQLTGSFPTWAGSLADPPHRIAAPADQFRAAVEGALAVADTDEPLITITTRAGGLTVSATAGRSKFEARVSVPGFAGPGVSIPLDGRRLLGVLDGYSDEHAIGFGFASAAEPVTLTAGDDCRCVLVPHIQRAAPTQAPRRVTLAKAS